MRQPVIEYFNYIGKDSFDNADYLHDNGFFIGNDVTNLRENIDMVFNALQQIGGGE